MTAITVHGAETHALSDDAEGRSRLLSERDCHEIMTRLTRLARGGGYTAVNIVSSWTGNVRWGRNRITTASDIRRNTLLLTRALQGASNTAAIEFSALSDASFVAALRRAERVARLSDETSRGDLVGEFSAEPVLNPNIFSESTYQLTATNRVAAATAAVRGADTAGMLSAGYIAVSAYGCAVLDSLGRSRYSQWTFAQVSTTVRSPDGTGSGWAGRDDNDWTRIDGTALATIALQKCIASRNPMRIEPGRYTVVLEPQAVCDLMGDMFKVSFMWRDGNEARGDHPFYKKPGLSRLGEKVVDERISLSTDPMDPELGYPSWYSGQTPRFGAAFPDAIHPLTWIDHGILTGLSYHREYAVRWLGRAAGAGQSMSFRMCVHGPTTTVDDMIASTKRGVLVTRFDRLELIQSKSQLYRGYTRDGLWLIENGKISHPVKNLAFTDSPLFALNKIEQLGTPQRVFHPPSEPAWLYGLGPMGAITPALKVSDFSFTAVSDSV